MPNVYGFNDPELFWYGWIQLLSGAIVFMIGVLFVLKYLQRRQKVLLTTSLGFIFLGSGIFIGALGYISALHAPTFQLGLSLLGGHVFWNTLGLSIAILSSVSLQFFSNYVFQRPRKTFVYLLGFFDILLSVYLFSFATFEFTAPLQGEQYRPAPQIVLLAFLILLLVPWIIILFRSYEFRKKEQDRIVRIGLTSILTGSFLTIISMIFYVLNAALRQKLEPLVWILGAISALIVYLGFGMPGWFRRLIQKQTA